MLMPGRSAPVLPGFIGIETGQAAFGDIYSWFRKLLLWSFETITMQSSSLNANQKQKLHNELDSKILPALERAILCSDDDFSLVSLDWFNGRRYPDLNEKVKGAITGLSLNFRLFDFAGKKSGPHYCSRRYCEKVAGNYAVDGRYFK